MQDLTSANSNDLGSARWSKRLKRYFRGLSSGQKMVFALNSTVVAFGLFFQALFLSTYDWVFLFDIYLISKQTLIWISHSIYLLLVICPVAVLLTQVIKGKISLHRANKSYLIVLLLIAPLLVMLLWFAIGAFPLLDIVFNPRKL